MQIQSIADPATILPKVRVVEPYPQAYLEVQPATEAYELVLANAGGTRPTHDWRAPWTYRDVLEGTSS